MMEHITQRDWCSKRNPTDPFVDVADINTCVIEKIIQNKFWNPMISSDEEDEPVGIIDWESVFSKKNGKDNQYRFFVPGHRIPPPHPRLSDLTENEHRHCVKVLCTKYANVLPKKNLGRINKSDYMVFEAKKEVYEKEQKEYIEWAKHLWVTTNCIRALRPKQTIEMVYEAEFKLKTHAMQCFPKTYGLAAQIPLKAEKHNCDIILPKKDLISVNIAKLPQIFYPAFDDNKVTILRACAVPEPCTKHPCKFVLPGEASVTLLPMTEVHKELAQFAIENGADFIASEKAITCLIETDQSWTIPVSVCEVISADGERSNVVVLGDDFPMKKDAAPMRTYKAFRHLLLKAFTSKTPRVHRDTDASDVSSSSFVHNMSLRSENEHKQDGSSRRGKGAMNKSYTNKLRRVIDQLEESDSSDDDRLLIDLKESNACENSEVFHFSADNDKEKSSNNTSEESRNSSDPEFSPPRKILKARPRNSENHEELIDQIGIYDCVCKENPELEIPPPRSYRNWQIKNYTTKDQINVIIHCSHKLKNDRAQEVLLEPIVEYQLDIGGTAQSPQKLQALAFSMMLRKNPELVTVRVDGVSGELVTVDVVNGPELARRHGEPRAHSANTIGTALNQLAGLMAGEYLLQHDPSHGDNALLFSVRGGGGGGERLELFRAESEAVCARDESVAVQRAPRLAPVLLPYHKHRRQLPLAFTYDRSQLVRETDKPITKKKTPPAAIQWPKRKKKRGKK